MLFSVQRAVHWVHGHGVEHLLATGNWQLAYGNDFSLMTTGKLLNRIVSIGQSVGQTMDFHFLWFSSEAKILGSNEHFTDIAA
jgi:hypothetical protein